AEAAGEGRDLLLEGRARRNRIEDGARVRALRLHPRDGRGIERLHVAVIVRYLPAPERFRHGLHGWGCGSGWRIDWRERITRCWCGRSTRACERDQRPEKTDDPEPAESLHRRPRFTNSATLHALA